MVFFECRLDQLASELSRANGEIERLKTDLAQAAQREVALKQELAAAESRAGQARREREDAVTRLDAAHRERERLLDKLIEAEKIRMAGEHVESLDLAAFIADLRSEVLALRSGAAPSPATVPSGYASTAQAADALASEGRIGITDSDRDALQAAARFETRSEETLFALSLRELSAPDATARMRAAQRLQSLSARAALPAIAAALNAEQAPEVLGALLGVCGSANEPSILPLVQARLTHDCVEVRLAALEAAVRLKDPTCLLRALDDECTRVRRRAAILASGRPELAGVLERAAHDAEPSVRRVAALGLASLGGPRAQEALLAALDDSDVSVRRAAAKGLSATLGPEVFAVADLDAARRHREIRRLAKLPEGGRIVAHASPAEPAAAPAPAAPKVDVEAEVLSRVYAALRGQSDDDLLKTVPAKAEQVLAAATALVGQGKLIRRGQRYFVP